MTWFWVYIACGFVTLIPMCIVAFLADKKLGITEILFTIFLWPIMLILLIIFVWILKKAEKMGESVVTIDTEMLHKTLEKLRENDDIEINMPVEQPKRKRGRPRKNRDISS